MCEYEGFYLRMFIKLLFVEIIRMIVDGIMDKFIVVQLYKGILENNEN